MSRALVASGYELYRLSVREVLERSGRYASVEEAGDMGSLVRASARGASPALVVLDPASLGLAPSDGVDLAVRLMPEAAFLVFVAEGVDLPLPAAGGRALRLLRHSARRDELEAALTALAEGGTATEPASHNGAGISAATAPVAEPATAVPLHPPRLSRRQSEILAMVAEGLANKQIAHRLGIAEGTVKAHIHAIFRALGVTNRTQAVVKYANLPMSA